MALRGGLSAPRTDLGTRVTGAAELLLQRSAATADQSASLPTRTDRPVPLDTIGRAVDRRDPVDVAALVSHRLDLLEEARPDPGLRPAIEVLVDRVPVPEPFGQITPRRPGAKPPRRLDHRASVYRRTARSLHRAGNRGPSTAHASSEITSRDTSTRLRPTTSKTH